MTVVAFTSLKGAPGVTTTACLVGATWPVERRVILVESDPAGGDLAARFSLSSARGWPTFVTAARRTAAASGAGEGTGPSAGIDPHLQALPGGLEVLLGTGATAQAGSEWAVTSVVAGCAGATDVLVDLGRLHPANSGPGGWLDRADLVAVVVGGDAASVLRVQEVRDQLASRCAGRLVLVVVRNGRYAGEEIEAFLGLPVIAELPYDPGAAAVASGVRSGARRLARSGLAAAAGRLARALVDRTAPNVAADETGGGDGDGAARAIGTGVATGAGDAVDDGDGDGARAGATPHAIPTSPIGPLTIDPVGTTDIDALLHPSGRSRPGDRVPTASPSAWSPMSVPTPMESDGQGVRHGPGVRNGNGWVR